MNLTRHAVAALFAVSVTSMDCAPAQNIYAGSGTVVITGDVRNTQITTGLNQAQLDEFKKVVSLAADKRTAEQELTIKLLSEKLRLNETQISAALKALGQQDVPSEQIGAKLVEFANNHLELKQRLTDISQRYPKLRELRENASALIEAGKFTEARALIQSEIEKSLNARLEAAELTALQAMTASLQFQTADAASLYQAASLLATGDPKLSVDYAMSQVRELVNGGDEHTRRDYLQDARRALARAAATKDIDTYPDLKRTVDCQLATVLTQSWNVDRNQQNFDTAKTASQKCIDENQPGQAEWIGAKSRLGTILFLSGELDGAIEIFRELQKQDVSNSGEAKRIVLGNLSSALAQSGLQKNDAGLLREAKQYAEKAVEISSDENDRHKSLYCYNLGIVSYHLGIVSSDEKMINEAAQRFKEALAFVSANAEPLSWALSHQNWGIALLTLGRMKKNPERFREAVEQFDLALTVWRQNEPLHQWRDAKLKQAEALIEGSALSPDLPGLTKSLAILQELKNTLPDNDSRDDGLVDIESLKGDSYAQIWRVTRAPRDRTAALNSYNQALQHIFVPLFDAAALAQAEERQKGISGKIRQIRSASTQKSLHKR